MIRKDGVRWFGMRPELALAITAAISVARNLNADLRVTSCTDGKHSNTSLHYAGAAFDCTLSKGWNGDRAKMFRDTLQHALGEEFDVILEQRESGRPSHIHVEFQPSTESRKRFS